MGKLFSHLMNISGVRHLEDFLIKPQAPATPEQQIVGAAEQQPATEPNSPVDEAQYQQQVTQALGAIDGTTVPETASNAGDGIPLQ